MKWLKRKSKLTAEQEIEKLKFNLEYLMKKRAKTEEELFATSEELDRLKEEYSRYKKAVIRVTGAPTSIVVEREHAEMMCMGKAELGAEYYTDRVGLELRCPDCGEELVKMWEQDYITPEKPVVMWHCSWACGCPSTTTEGLSTINDSDEIWAPVTMDGLLADKLMRGLPED